MSDISIINKRVRRSANMNFDFLDNLDIDQDVKQRLSTHLHKTVLGNSDIYISPIAKEHGADRILSEWSKIFDGNREIMNDTLLTLEDSQRSKVGPRSIAKPWSERRDSVNMYFEHTNINYSDLDFTPFNPRDKGILRSISLANALKLLKNDTNSGLPYFTRKGKIKDKLIRKFDSMLKHVYPCLSFTRTQEQGKTRLVWGYPVSESLYDMMLFKPVLEYQKKQFWRSALSGPDSVSKHLTHIITEAYRLQLKLVSNDFSAYDTSITPELMFEIIKYFIYLFQRVEEDRLLRMTHVMSTIPLVTPDEIKDDKHSLPTGADFTNEFGSVCQLGLLKKSDCVVNNLFDIQGDDGVCAVKSENVDKLFATFEKYGFKVNRDKSYISDNYLVYLQNLYHMDYMKNGVINGIYPTYRALNRILYQERWANFEDFGIKGSDYYAIRTISILENCKHHPLFEKLVTFILKYDKYKLQFSHIGVRQYIEMINDSSGSEGILNNQYGDNIKGIKSFETFKLITKLTKNKA